MPGTSKAKNPAGIDIVFTEDTHEYKSIINSKVIDYISGTTFLGQYFPKFDPDGSITARCAKKQGLTVEALRKQWNAKGAESCRLGTRMHETIEDALYGRKLRNIAESEIEQSRFNNAITMAKKIMARADILGIEKIVFDSDLQIAGTIDLLAKSKSAGEYLIIDHKSNDKYLGPGNMFNKFCLEPIGHIPDTPYWHYALQLSLYCYLLKFGNYVPKKAKFRLFLNHVTAKNVELIELPNLQSEIKDLVITYLLKKKS